MPKKPMVKCGKCNTAYRLGTPHSMFCRGNVKDDDVCVACGYGMKDGAILSECACGEPVCECCKEVGAHDC